MKKLALPMTAVDLDYYHHCFETAAKDGTSPTFHSTHCKVLAKLFKTLCEHKPVRKVKDAPTTQG